MIIQENIYPWIDTKVLRFRAYLFSISIKSFKND